MKAFRHCFLCFNIILIVSLLSIPNVWACGGGSRGYDYSKSAYKLIDPEIITPYSYKTFLEKIADRYSNHNEWQEINEAHLQVSSIDFLLTGESRQVLEKKFNTITDPTAKAIYQYIIFTRDVAPYVTNRGWRGYSDIRERKQKMDELLNLSRKRAEEIDTASPFLRFRYSFQALRLASVLNQHELVEKIYLEKIAPIKTKSIVRYWAQGYYARAQLILKRPVDALLTYAAIYDQCPPMMNTVISSLRYIKRKNFKPALERVKKSKHRQATLRLLETLTLNRDYSAEPLKILVELEPKADRAEFLLSRIFTTINDFNSIGDIRIMVRQDFSIHRYTELIEICKERGEYWRAANKLDRSGLWSIIGSYLALLDGNNDIATALLAKVEPGRLTDVDLKLALRQVQSMASIAKASAGTHPLSDTDLTNISNLMQDIKDVNALNSWRLLMAEYFNQQNDLVRSLACLRFFDSRSMDKRAGRLISLRFVTGALALLDDKQWQQLEDFVAGENLSTFDQYLLNTFPDLSLQAIIYRRGKMYQTANKHEKAIEQFNRLGEGFWSKKQSRFSHRLKIPAGQQSITTKIDQYKVTESSPLLKKEPDIKILNARQYSQHMVKLQKELSQVSKMSAEEAQKLYFRMGNLEYYQFAINVPGHRRLLTERRVKRSYRLYFWGKNLHPAVMVRIQEANHWQDEPSLICDKALAYYNKAIEIDADPEITAQSLIMASASKNVFLHVKLKPNDPSLADDLKYHKKLAANYQETEFYQEYLKECPLLKMFN